jgi:hypothetical protein
MMGSQEARADYLAAAVVFQRHSAELYEAARIRDKWRLGDSLVIELVIEAQLLAAKRARLSRMMLYHAGVISDRDF